MTQLIGGETFSRDVSVGRDRGIGGSDARYIMSGEWKKLYREKLGLDPLPDFDSMFNVQLGKYTEPFHLKWLAKIGKVDLVEPHDFYVHPQVGGLFAHLDGWCLRHDTFIEAKHCDGGRDFREQARNYLPQIAHECLVTGKAFGLFSAIRGNEEPVCELVQPASDYIEQYFEMAKQFLWHLEEKIEPEDQLTLGQQTTLFEAGVAAEATLIGGLRDYDMTSNNAWAEQAGLLIKNKQAATDYKKADEEIRKLAPKDGAVIKGHGVQFKRDARGALRISFT